MATVGVKGLTLQLKNVRSIMKAHLRLLASEFLRTWT